MSAYQDAVNEGYRANVDDETREFDLNYRAWVVIANARDWLLDDEQAATWRAAAVGWRDAFHETLGVQHRCDNPVHCSTCLNERAATATKRRTSARKSARKRA